jgi:hypothetical protein
LGEFRIKAAIAGHEFEADGPTDDVRAQFEVFTRLVLRLANVETPTAPSAAPAPPSDAQRFADMLLFSGKRPFLKTPGNPTDAVLLMLLAYKEHLDSHQVSGSDIMHSLRQSGLRIPRADHILNRYADNGIVAVSGHRRLRRYRLTPAGLERAQQLVLELSPHAT